MRSFFIKFQKDLKNHDITTSPSKAVQTTRREAKEFFKSLLKLSEREGDDILYKVFNPLDNDEEDKPRYELQSLKARGKEYKSWLRVYAIKHGDIFVITGGAIKLTNRMEDRTHTKNELYKLQLVKKYLKSDNAEFVYLHI